MNKPTQFCLIAGSTIGVCILAWSTSPNSLSQMEAMAKKKTELDREAQRAEIVRNRAVTGDESAAIQEAALISQQQTVAPKESAAFLATEARFTNAATEKPAATPEGDVVNYGSPPAPKNRKIIVAPAPGYTVAKPKLTPAPRPAY